MKFKLDELGYNYNALEPYIDAQTMEIHHTKHHGAYVSNLNAALEGHNTDNMNIEDILAKISQFPVQVRNNGGGHYNHNLFWRIISPGAQGEPQGELMQAIKRDFESFENFKNLFSKAAATRFGSGWAWLLKKDNKLLISSTPNQDNPLMDVAEMKGTPVLGLDVWEHAYYLKYQNKRAAYVDGWWNVVNWADVAARLAKARG
jgi:Fe-Mn family superoxide dismutase